MQEKSQKEAMGARLSAARIKSGMSLVEVGMVIKRNKGTISKWERGVDSPSPETLRQLAILYRQNDFIPAEKK
jgi:transcriptional regulator with XRE-family HTH domain